MALLKIAVLNSTSAVTASEIQDWIAACKIQMNRDYFRSAAKSGTVSITYYAKGATPPLDAWWIALTDTADVADALGYHDLTPSGLPFGKVFVETALLYGEKPSVTLSHELLEMLGDPFVNQLVVDGGDILQHWAKEECDSVEAFTYDITLPATTTKPQRNIPVSDFVLANYWNPVPTKRPYSFKDNLTGPVPALAKGGYMAFVKNGVWSQITNFKTAESNSSARAKEVIKTRIDGPLDKRRIKRTLPREVWVKTTTTKVA